MPKRKNYDYRMIKIGDLLREKRLAISKESRESFIEERSKTMFGDDDWISLRYLANIESGNNLPSIEMLIKLAIAYETDPVELFESIYEILYDK